MTIEAECLLATLRHTSEGAPPLLDWSALLELAERHGLFMLFCREFRGEMPQEFALRQRSRWTTAALMASELERVLREFSRRGIEVIPLKGPVLANLLYGSTSLRICEDLDLLVHPKDIAATRSLLTDLGFELAIQADDYHESFKRGEALGEETVVEVHFEVAPPSNPAIDLDVAWARARVVEFRGQRARFFAPPDLLMYLLIHGVKHGFSRLLWVMDVARALGELNDEDAKVALAMAKASGIEGALLTTCALAQHSFRVALPESIAGAIARQPRIPVRAAAMLQEILEGPGLLQSPHQGAPHFLHLESSVRARWRQRLRVLRPSQQDYAWARSHHVNARWMPFLRPLRLLLKHGPEEVWRTFLSRLPAVESAREADKPQIP